MKLSENFEIKIISVILAVILWFYALGQQKSEIIFNIPLEIKIKENMIVYDQTTEFVTITLRGQQNVIKGLSKSQFRIVVNLKEDQPGIVNYVLTSQNILGPKEVEIIDTSPKRFSAKIDYLDSKELPVKVITQGELPYGYFVETLYAEPEQIRVQGVKSIIDNLEFLETLPVLIRGAKTSFANVLRLKKQDDGIKIIGNQEVKVSVKVLKEEILTIPIDVIYNTNLKSNVFPTVLEATVLGNNYLFESLERESLKAVIDAKKLKKGEYLISNKDIKFNFSENFKIKQINPKEIKLILE